MGRGFLQERAAESSRLILASGSPRRQSLLRGAGYEFLIHPADIDEEGLGQGIGAEGVAVYLARAKAELIAEKYPGDVVLAADTVVVVGDQVLGKARDAADARRILLVISGTTHRVISGVAVMCRNAGLSLSEQVVSSVEMKLLEPGEIDAYIAGGQWRGKAGAYGIQDRDPFVRRIGGCLTNIVGLPMKTTARLLGEAGIIAGKSGD